MDYLKKSDFFYDLPHELIAQHPIQRRDASRLMCLDRNTGEVSHRVFRDLVDLLGENDVLVINDSRVIPARLIGKKESGARVEILLLKDEGDDCWQALVKPGKRLKDGAVVDFDGARAHIVSTLADGKRLVKFEYDKSEPFMSLLDRIGTMPLPPYITERLEEPGRYQTVYAEHNGSAAAPTAGLHFTPELLAQLEQNGVTVCRITLHVGLGTFRPVKEELITNHIMHSEYFCVEKQVADALNTAKDNGKRIIAVGTTCCRTLEAVMRKYGKFVPCCEETSIFIYPGYDFKAIDALITNFHLPESTLIMLVCAFAGYDATMNAYKTAVNGKYRFFSFGDAMFIS